MAEKSSKTKVIVDKRRYRPIHAKRKIFGWHRGSQFMSFILMTMLVSTLLPLSAIAQNVEAFNAEPSEVASTTTTNENKTEASVDEPEPAAPPAPEADAGASDADTVASDTSADVGNTDTTAGDATGAANAGIEAGEDDLIDKVDSAGPAAAPVEPSPTAPSASDPDMAPMAAPIEKTLWVEEVELNIKWSSVSATMNRVEITASRDGAVVKHDSRNVKGLSPSWSGEWIVADQVFFKIEPIGNTLNVEWEQCPLQTVTYTHDGGGDFDPVTYTSLITSERMPDPPGAPGWPKAKPGYAFAGWAGTIPATVGSGGTYTATYIQVEAGYKVTYDLNGGEGTVEDTKVYMPGDTVTVSSDEPTREGNRFVGWDFNDQTYRAGQTVEMVEGGITFTAKWEQSRTIIYEPGAHGKWNAELNHVYTAYDGDATPNFNGDLAIEHDATHIFAGWLNEGTGATYQVGEPLPPVAGDATYIAQWTPYNPIFESVDEYKVYDGAPLTTPNSNSHFVIGRAMPYYKFEFSNRAEVVDATEASAEHNNTARVEIYFLGERVTDMFSEIRSEVEPGTETGYYTNWGTLTVGKRPVTLTSNSDSKAYDGTPLVNTEVSVEPPPETAWATGEGFRLVATGSITDVGTAENTIVYEHFDNTKPSNYDITTLPGTLTITANSNPIVVTTPSASKPYDGLPLTNTAYSVSGLPAGHRLVVTVTGEQVEVGSSENLTAGDYTIYNRDNVNVTSFFTNISEVNGTLTVTAAAVVPDPDPDPDPGVVVPIVPVVLDPAPEVVIPEPEVPIGDVTTQPEAPVIDAPQEQNTIDDPVPLSSPAATDYWALLNLILAVLTAVFALVLLVVVATRRKKDKQDGSNEKAVERTDSDEETTKRAAVWPAILSVLAAIGAVVLFVLTENTQLPMTMVDEWTLWQAVICVAAVVLLAVGARSVTKASDQRVQEN